MKGSKTLKEQKLEIQGDKKVWTPPLQQKRFKIQVSPFIQS